MTGFNQFGGVPPIQRLLHPLEQLAPCLCDEPGSRIATVDPASQRDGVSPSGVDQAECCRTIKVVLFEQKKKQFVVKPRSIGEDVGTDGHLHALFRRTQVEILPKPMVRFVERDPVTATFLMTEAGQNGRLTYAPGGARLEADGEPREKDVNAGHWQPHSEWTTGRAVKKAAAGRPQPLGMEHLLPVA